MMAISKQSLKALCSEYPYMQHLVSIILLSLLFTSLLTILFLIHFKVNCSLSAVHLKTMNIINQGSIFNDFFVRKNAHILCIIWWFLMCFYTHVTKTFFKVWNITMPNPTSPSPPSPLPRETITVPGFI